ncbi:hypothetical protein [Sphingomonas parapaucimobilis]|uniref:hypothetical protein n=1 Tax=Sphingomonas parapaucimobilis TaxID=28213 RepID=UPI003219AB67
MAEHIDDFIETKARTDASYAIAYALLQVARAQRDTAIAVKNLDLAHIAERIEIGAGAIAGAIESRE